MITLKEYKYVIPASCQKSLRKDIKFQPFQPFQPLWQPCNIDIPGYNEFIFEPTETTHGGTGFYIKGNLDFHIRSDLNPNSTNLSHCLTR